MAMVSGNAVMQVILTCHLNFTQLVGRFFKKDFSPSNVTRKKTPVIYFKEIGYFLKVTMNN